MKFITNTKPLADALNLGIINSNVSNFYKKSCVVQLSADAHTLKINIEAAMICTEIRLKGSGSGEASTVFVDSMLLKQLVGTLETATVEIEFAENGIIIQSGKSKFNLPKVIDNAEFELRSPILPEYAAGSVSVNKPGWKFVKDFQMYAISLAFIHPVYTRVWVGDAGDVLVGDFDSSLFTHSKKSNLNSTCLLSDTIINLLNSLPDDAKLIPVEKDYIIQLTTDSFTYTTQFTPMYEDDEEVGSYNSEIFLEMMQHPDSSCKVSTAAAVKLLNQALLLSTTSEDTIHLSVEGTVLRLQDRNVNGVIPIEGDANLEFTVEFKLDILKQVISNYSDDTIRIGAMKQEDEVVGIIVWNDDLTTIVAGVE